MKARTHKQQVQDILKMLAAFSVLRMVKTMASKTIYFLFNIHSISRINDAILYFGNVFFHNTVTHFLSLCIPFAVAFFIIRYYTEEKSFNWYNAIRFGLGFTISAVSSYLTQIILSLLLTSTGAGGSAYIIYRATWQTASYYALAYLFLPMQTYCEEYCFRDTLAKNPTLTNFIVSSLLFAYAHLYNPEMSLGPIMLLFYFSFGIAAALPVYLTGSIDYSWGLHTHNNLNATLDATSTNSAIPGMSKYIFPNPTPSDVLTMSLREIINGTIFSGLCYATESILAVADSDYNKQMTKNDYVSPHSSGQSAQPVAAY